VKIEDAKDIISSPDLQLLFFNGWRTLAIESLRDFYKKIMLESYLDKFNNDTAKKVATDPQARIGCKGKEKFWYGYKRNVSVCMKLGFITKIAVTPANMSVGKALRHICRQRLLWKGGF